MISHIELVVHTLLEMVGGWLCALAMTLVVALAATAFLGLNLYKFDREAALRGLRRLSAGVSRGWGWILLSGLMLMQVYGLDVLRAGLLERLTQEDQARYIAADDQGGAPTTQRAPKISFLETTVRSQQIVLPPQLASLGAVPGWSPEEARYADKPAVNVTDQLIKDNNAVVLNRTTEVQRWVPTKLQRSEVELRLNFLGRTQNRKRRTYQAEFEARYSFQNPFPEARRFHFSFPLPDNSGTLSAFKFKVNGADLPPTDIDRGLDYEIELKPAEKAQVAVSYGHLGSQAWSYDVTGRREPIADFHLSVRSDDMSDIRFLRGSLYPSASERGLLSWNLQNQITSQSIQLFFPFVPTEQLVRNLYVYAPLGVLMQVLLIAVWARLRRTRTSAWCTALASLASCCGYCLACYLLSYLPLALTLLVSVGATAALQAQVLGRRLWVPVLAGSLAPFTFLASGNTGLLLSLLGLAALALTIQETVRRRD